MICFIRRIAKHLLVLTQSFKRRFNIDITFWRSNDVVSMLFSLFVDLGNKHSIHGFSLQKLFWRVLNCKNNLNHSFVSHPGELRNFSKNWTRNDYCYYYYYYSFIYLVNKVVCTTGSERYWCGPTLINKVKNMVKTNFGDIKEKEETNR